jgi:hypothetical protein
MSLHYHTYRNAYLTCGPETLEYFEKPLPCPLIVSFRDSLSGMPCTKPLHPSCSRVAWFIQTASSTMTCKNLKVAQLALRCNHNGKLYLSQHYLTHDLSLIQQVVGDSSLKGELLLHFAAYFAVRAGRWQVDDCMGSTVVNVEIPEVDICRQPDSICRP